MGLLDEAVKEDNFGTWSLWIYGYFGCGKTVLACSASNAIHLDLEKSRRVLKKPIHKELLLNTPSFDFSVPDRVSALRSFLNKLRTEKSPEVEAIKTVVIDTSTAMQKRDLNHIMKEAVQKNSNRDIDVPSEAEYTKNNRRITRLLQDFIETSGKNVIILGHVKEEKDDDGNTVLTRPGNSPSLMASIAEMVDGVFYMSSNTDSKGVTTRELQLMPSRKLIAKNRFDLPNKITNPNFQTDIEPYLN